MKKKPKNIPSPYKSTGTPIYRDTTALPFDEGGNMENPPIQFPSTFPFNYNYNFLNPNYKVVNENPNAGTESWFNPMNWFVPRMDQETTFNNAFEKAKRSGYSEFIYNGKRYNTKSNMTPAQQMKVYGITDEQRITDPWQPRKNLSTMNTEEGYSGGAEIAFNRMLGNSPGLNFPSNEADSPGAKEQDAFKLYLGLPQSYNTFQPSKYKKGALELTGYNALLPDIMPSDKELEKYGVPKYSETWGNQKNPLKPYDDFVMGRHTVKKGKDSRGEYIEYIDKWDLDTYKYNIDNRLFNAEVPVGSMADMLNKPFDIYGRKYYKDYGDGVKKTMYYSDQELQSFNPKNKNFDTLALQKELANRGYKFPKSTTKSGEFDGVYGEETKKALQDWQSKNFQPGETYTFSGRPGSYYKYTEEGNMLIKNKNTGGKYIPMTDEDGKRLKTLQAGLATGKTKKFLDGGPLVDKTNHGDLLPSVYASALGNYYADGGPQPIKGSMYTYTSKDGTVTNKFVNTEGNTVIQVKTPDGKYYEKILPKQQTQNFTENLFKDIASNKYGKPINPEKYTYVDPISTQKIEFDSKQDFIDKTKNKLLTGKTVINKGDEIVPALGTVLEFTGVPGGIRTLNRLKEDPLKFAKDIGTAVVDVATLPQNLMYKGANYLFGDGKFDVPIDTEALGVTLDAAGFLPFVPKGARAVKMIGDDIARGYNKVATGNSFLTDLGVRAWKVERPTGVIRSSDYIVKPYTDYQTELFTKYGFGMRDLTPEDWEHFSQLTKSGVTDFSKGNYPISRTIGYYAPGSTENKVIQGLKRGDVFKTPTEKSIRTWSVGVPKLHSGHQGRTRLIIPSRYTKDLGSHFAGMPYYDKRVDFIWNHPVTKRVNTSAFSEKELMGNIPGGFKVIGTSSEDGMNNLIIKPIRNRAKSGLQANTNKNSTSGLVQSDVSKTVDDQIKWITSDEYFKRRSANTGETYDQISKDVDRIIYNAKTAEYNLNAKLPKNILGEYTPKGIQTLWGPPTVNISATAKNPLMILKHETGHLYSPSGFNSPRNLHKGSFNPDVANLPASERGVYANYPELGYTDVGYRNYLQSGPEQQVRHLNARNQILDRFNLASDAQLTEKEVAPFVEDWATKMKTEEGQNLNFQDYDALWERESEKITQELINEKYNPKTDFPNIATYTEMFESLPAAEKTMLEKERNSRLTKRITDVLNKAWVAAPAAIGLDAAVEESTNNYAKGGMIKRADGSYSPRGLWDNIRAAAAKNKAAGKPGKAPSKEMLAQAKKIEAEEKQLGGYLYGRGGQFPTPYSLPEDSFKQGGDNLHNSVYASSMAQYPATYAEGGLLDTNPEPTPEFDNRTKTMMYLLSKGLDPNQAAGIAGNLEQESGFNPTARNKSGYTGIAQWDKKNRWPAVKKYIESQGLDPWSLEGQLEGLYWEANKRGDWNKIAQTTNPAESTAAWLKYFERSGEKPGQAGYEKRINYANNLAADENVLNKVLAFSPPNINELPLEEFPLITNEVPQTFNNNYIEEVEPMPVETPVFFPTNSPTSLMNLANIQRLNTLKYGGSFQMPRQQMYMPLDNVERFGGPQHNAYRKGGSVFYATNTPQLEGEGKDLTYPQNAYIYTSGGLINNFNIKRYEL